MLTAPVGTNIMAVAAQMRRSEILRREAIIEDFLISGAFINELSMVEYAPRASLPITWCRDGSYVIDLTNGWRLK